MWISSADLVRAHSSRFIVFVLGDFRHESSQTSVQTLREILKALRPVRDLVCPVVFGEMGARKTFPPLDEKEQFDSVEPVTIYIGASDEEATSHLLQPFDFPPLAIKVVLIPTWSSGQATVDTHVGNQWEALSEWVGITETMPDRLTVFPGSGAIILVAAKAEKANEDTGRSFTRREDIGTSFRAGAGNTSSGTPALMGLMNGLWTLLVEELSRELRRSEQAFLAEAEDSARLRTEVERLILQTQKQIGTLHERLSHSRSSYERLQTDYRFLQIELETRAFQFESDLKSQREREEFLVQSLNVGRETVASLSAENLRLQAQIDGVRTGSRWRRITSWGTIRKYRRTHSDPER
jgi:hypothetical protein